MKNDSAVHYTGQLCKRHIGFLSVFSVLSADIHMLNNNALVDTVGKPYSLFVPVYCTKSAVSFEWKRHERAEKDQLQRKGFIIMCRPSQPHKHLHMAVIRSFNCLMWYDSLSPL